MRAYILLKIQPQETDSLMHSLMTLNSKRIVQACLIHGAFDCIVEVRAKAFQGIADVVEQIRSLKGVNDTQTCFVMRTAVPEPKAVRGVFEPAQ